jgi:insecticidal toxin complex protein TccC
MLFKTSRLPLASKLLVDTTLHIGTHILSESSKDNAQTTRQTRYQLNSHLQSNTLELDDQAQTLSYEHYYFL